MKVFAILLGLVLPGCATVPPPAPADWDLQASATAGAALVLADTRGGDALRIACRRNPTDLYVASDASGPSSGPVTLTVGRRGFALSPGVGEPRLSATAALPDDLAAALMSAETVVLTRPGGRVGPFAAPDPKTAAAFAIACRR